MDGRSMNPIDALTADLIDIAVTRARLRRVMALTPTPTKRAEVPPHLGAPRRGRTSGGPLVRPGRGTRPAFL
jgi:hypothetical protein